MGDLNKTKYYGYKPKDNNLAKLQHYLLTKNANKTQTTQVNEKIAKLSSNKVLQNKRF